MKKQRKKQPTKTRASRGAARARRMRAVTDAMEWALDVAHAIARDVPEEIDAVERVRRFVRTAIAGRPAHVPLDDLLITLALVFGAIDREVLRDLENDLDGHGAFTLIRHHLASRVRLPSARELWERSFPHYFVPSSAWQRAGLPVARA